MLCLFFLFATTTRLVCCQGRISLFLPFSHTLVLVVDVFTLVFVHTLIIVSSRVLLWSYYYLDTDLKYKDFIFLVISFLLSMVGLVLAGNLLIIFVFWDLLGFTSLFLVFYFRSRSSLSGGMLTGLTNRFGDILLLLLFGFCFSGITSTYAVWFYLLVVVAFTKSAQVPFSAWLPAAILAPTPVSSLVHSSTLVTAGIYLLFRFLPLALFPLFAIGLLTSLRAGLAAVLESDIKKIIALSTLSQLGMIISSLGLGLRNTTFSHLIIHALFKSLLFLAVGVALHSLYSSQDSRRAANFVTICPLVLSCLSISILSMCGIFFLRGWVTKDAILESCLCSSTSTLGLVLFYLTIGLTVSYSLRLVNCLFSSTSHFAVLTRLTGAASFCKYPLWTLGGISILGGHSVISKFIIWNSVAWFTDKRLIIGIALLGSFLGSLLWANRELRSSLVSYNSVCTSFLRSGQRSMDYVFALECSPLSSYYLGGVAGFVRASSPSYIIFLRAVILCCPLFLI